MAFATGMNREPVFSPKAGRSWTGTHYSSTDACKRKGECNSPWSRQGEFLELHAVEHMQQPPQRGKALAWGGVALSKEVRRGAAHGVQWLCPAGSLSEAVLRGCVAVSLVGAAALILELWRATLQ